MNARGQTTAFERQRHAAHQPAAAARDQHTVQRHAQPRRIFGDFQPRRALPRNHAGIVERPDQHRAALGAEFSGNRFAVLALAVIFDHRAAQRPGAVDLGAGRIRRHYDHRLHSEQCRGGGHALRVIAG